MADETRASQPQRPPLAQRGVRARVPPRPLDRQSPARPVHVSRTPRRSARGSACRCRARSAARCSATRSSGCCARPSRAREPACRAGHDVVVVARPDALELAEREGLAGLDAALAELLGRAGLRRARRPRTPAARTPRTAGGDERAGSGSRGSRTARSSCCGGRRARSCSRRSSSTSALISPAIPRRCKYEPTCSRYAVEAVREYGILRGLVLAGWRLLRCNPWSYGGYDPVEAQRVFRTRPDGDS